MCSLISNPLLSGFWALTGDGSDWQDSGDEFLEKVFNKQQENLTLFSAFLASSSLSISFSTLFHLITIYFMLQGNIFKKFRQHWNSGLFINQVGIMVMILICLTINISRYFMCIENYNIWLDFVVRLSMISICTPTSIVLEWTCFRLYHGYLEMFKHCTVQVLSYGAPNLPSKDSVLSAYLGRGYLSNSELREWKTSVSRYTSVIGSLLEQKTGHHFRPIDTGSIVERFGLPLASSKGLSDLQTDHDVMFVPTNVLVSEQGGSVKMVTIDELEEYVHLLSQNPECNLLNNITDNENYIDNMEAKTLLDTLVTNVSMKEFQLETQTVNTKTLLGMTCLTLTQRLLKWNRVQTAIRGPAVNFKVKTAHLNPSLSSHDEWIRQADCDFILAFHLDHWPQIAREWIARPRYWPSPEIVDRIVITGCEVVPKVRSTQDNKAWRLSFSMAERVLSCHVGEKARKTYLAVKIFVKQRQKKLCPFLKTYHIKTIFFHHMESRTEEYWQDTELESTIKDFLECLVSTLQSGFCPHYFIPTVNLWGEQILGESAKKVSAQASRGCKNIRKTMKDSVCKFIIPREFKSDLLLRCMFSASPTWFYTRATVLVLVTEVLLLVSLPVMSLCLAVLFQTALSWLMGMVSCLPVLILFTGIMLLLRQLFLF
jgi:hypothetical protein